MDNKSKKLLWLIAGVTLLLVGTMIWIFAQSFNWNESFKKNDKNPYGCSILSEVLQKTVGDENFITVGLEESKVDTLYHIDMDSLPENSNYIFVGNQMFLDSKETDFLLKFAQQGNQVFLICKSFDQGILDSLFLHPKELLAQLIDNSYTPLDDRHEKRIPCGYYDHQNRWHNTFFKNPNGYIDQYGDWQELKPKDYDSYSEEIIEEDSIEEENKPDSINDGLEKENYDEDGYWLDPEEEAYDEASDTLGYYGKDGRWFSQKDSVQQIRQYYFQSAYFRPKYYISNINDSLASFNFYPEKLRLENSLNTVKIYEQLPINYSWNYFKDFVLEDSIAKPEKLGQMVFDLSKDDYTNFVALNYGKGKVFLHTTPLLLTNYMLTKAPYFEYADRVFDQMGTGAIIWDESIREPHEIKYENDYDNPKYHPEQGPLTFILSKTSLRWAWYVLLITLVLYLLFGLRRKQRVIPVTIPNVNTSKEYAETIAQLYMEKGKHKEIIQLKMDLFKSFLRTRFSINTLSGTPQRDQKLITAIVRKTNVNKAHIEDIFETYYSSIKNENVTTEKLVYFHDLLEEFYKKSK